jgi:hypothetical protein
MATVAKGIDPTMPQDTMISHNHDIGADKVAIRQANPLHDVDRLPVSVDDLLVKMEGGRLVA